MKANRILTNVALALLTSALCLGCYSTGHEIPADNLQKLKVGVTTEQETIDLLGKPTSRTRSSDGTVILSFLDFKIVPIPFHPTGHSKSVTVFFDQEGKFKKYTESGTEQ